jgi:transaldolase
LRTNGVNAVFLDRDGVINELVYHEESGVIDSPFTLDQFRLLPYVGEAIKLLNQNDVKVIIVSNQPGIAKNHFTEAILEATTNKMEKELADLGASLDGVYYCLHHPEATNSKYLEICDCRKPKPGLILKAARELSVDLKHSYVVGDNLSDIKAGKAAQCRTILLGKLKCELCHLIESENVRPDHIATNLYEAAQIMLTNGAILTQEVNQKMEIFLDTANVEEIKDILAWGVVTGLTTNQKIFLAEKGCNFRRRVQEILALIDGPISIEATSSTLNELMREAREFASWDNTKIVIKVPMFGDGRGLHAASVLEKEGIKTNMTALMSTQQVWLAARAGATFASIFFNRVKDYGDDPEKVIAESRALMDRGNFRTKIIVGSIRKPEDVMQAALAGAHIITVPYKILKQMPFHAKTEETIAEFDRAWEEFKKAEINRG